jgi:hypothetical protein
MKRFRIISLIFALVVLVLLACPAFLKQSAVMGQKRNKRLQRRAATTRATSKTRVDYSSFSHATTKHQGACNTCHKAPTDNWKKVRDFPDIADYPGHDACVSCHRPQFFKGANPVICSVCHSKVSPRDDKRFAFRNPAGSREFLVEFPHDKHQDVIAKLFRRPQQETRSLFQRVSFAYSSFDADDKTKHYNNCEICHIPRTTVPNPPLNTWVDSFVPDAAAFKAVPSSHASCFNCHWKSQQPVSENCAGCHKSMFAAIAPLLPTGKLQIVSNQIRISLKFRHAREQHVQECTSCHINITKATTLRGLKPDVPITSCATCHNKDGLRQDVSTELQAIDRNRDFVCSYCHTSDVGRRDPPFGHYLIAGRNPIKRQDVK